MANPKPEAVPERPYPTEAELERILDVKMRGRRDPAPYRPQTIAEVQSRLEAFVTRRLPDEVEVPAVVPLSGGTSKEQFVFDLATRSGPRAGLVEKLVLRLEPGESICETSRLREFEVVRAVEGTIPVPRARWLDPEGTELGRPGLIFDYCQGVTRPPAGDDIRAGPRQGFGPRFRALLGPQYMAHLGALGRFDWSGKDLASFDKPRVGSNEGALWQVNFLRRVWEEDKIEPLPLVNLTFRWLIDNAPPLDHVSIIHADFRGGNFLFDPDSGEITAVLDWEQAHLGDRHEDLAYILKPLFAETDETGRLLIGGFYPRDEFLERYAEASGLPVDERRLDYYDVFIAWKIVIGLTTSARVAQGRKNHQNIVVAWMADLLGIALADLRHTLTSKGIC